MGEEGVVCFTFFSSHPPYSSESRVKVIFHEREIRVWWYWRCSNLALRACVLEASSHFFFQDRLGEGVLRAYLSPHPSTQPFISLLESLWLGRRLFRSLTMNRASDGSPLRHLFGPCSWILPHRWVEVCSAQLPTFGPALPLCSVPGSLPTFAVSGWETRTSGLLYIFPVAPLQF